MSIFSPNECDKKKKKSVPLTVNTGSRFLTNSSFASSPHDGHGDDDDHEDHKEEDLKLPEVRIQRR